MNSRTLPTALAAALLGLAPLAAHADTIAFQRFWTFSKDDVTILQLCREESCTLVWDMDKDDYGQCPADRLEHMRRENGFPPLVTFGQLTAAFTADAASGPATWEYEICKTLSLNYRIVVGCHVAATGVRTCAPATLLSLDDLNGKDTP